MERHGVNEVHVNANSCHLAEPAEAPALPPHAHAQATAIAGQRAAIVP